MRIVVRFSLALFLMLSATLAQGARGAPTKYNVLFIPVDDLKPTLGCFGATQVHSPNIDALAKRGVRFTRAYCQQAVCSPSRASVMTGCRPDTTRVYDLATHFRKALPNVITLPQQFKEHGYFAASVGKIYHPNLDDPPSWSIPNNYKLGGQFFDPNLQKPGEPKLKRGKSFEIVDCADEDLPDGKVAMRAIEMLRAYKDRPFFIAAGFYRPHLPFVAPRKYYDLYPPDSIKLADNPQPPVDGPKIALHNSGELRQYTDIPKKGPIPEEKARELVRGYYAATTFSDAQIGKVIDELDRLDLAKNTIIVLWGDHGWHLGDHGLWNKQTNFEEAARAPLIVYVPGMRGAGKACDALVEFVDIYPTLCELAGLPLPATLEGQSFARLLDDPSQPFRQAAFSQYPRGKIMGYSMRTPRYRYTQWQEKDGKVTARELYDHDADPEENVNLANRPETKDLVASLQRELEAGWKAAAPK
jgi:arylsulfatase A-like enzyme